jgi:hypothetical protein
MPLIVSNNDVTQALIRTDAMADSIDQAVEACKALDPLLRKQWKTWLTGADGKGGYRHFSKTNRDLPFFTFGLATIFNQAVAYEHQLNAWNEKISRACRNAQPPIMTHDNMSARAWKDFADNIVPPVDPSTKFLIGGGIVFGALGLVFLLRVIK